MSAFVDGELGIDERARVAAAITHDPDLARQVMVLRKLKSALADAIEERPVELPSSAGWSFTRQAAAAVILACIVGAAALWIYLGSPRHDDTNGVEALWRAHGSWAANGDAVGAGALLRLTGAHAGFGKAYVPNLEAAKLNMVHAAISQIAGRTRLVVGYKGTRGCRVTLLVFEANDRPFSQPMIRNDNGALRANWHSGALQYALMAKGMARGRFELLVSSVAEASLRRLPLEPETRVALTQSRARSKPCKLA